MNLGDSPGLSSLDSDLFSARGSSGLLTITEGHTFPVAATAFLIYHSKSLFFYSTTLRETFGLCRGKSCSLSSLCLATLVWGYLSFPSLAWLRLSLASSSHSRLTAPHDGDGSHGSATHMAAKFTQLYTAKEHSLPALSSLLQALKSSKPGTKPPRFLNLSAGVH